MQNNNPTRFYCKEEIEQGHDKKTYPRLVLNKLKVMGNSTFIYNRWAFSSKEFLKKLPMYMWSMFSHVWTMNEVKLNQEWIKIWLKLN
jgi:hypothetical protein